MENINLTAVMDHKTVIGEGPIPADIMIIGEAPGETEEKLGRPFVGKAGTLLTQQMHSAGLTRKTCYITNVVKIRPDYNNIHPIIDLSKKKIRTSAEWDAWVELLAREITQVDPKIIVAVGSVPFYALCNLRGITKYRGSILESTLVPGRTVVPIIHTSAALRQYIWRHLILFDLIRVKKLRNGPFPITTKQREYIISPSFIEVMSYLERCNSGLVAFDIEVNLDTLQIPCISFSNSPDSAISIPFIKNGRDYFSPPQEAQIWQKIAEILESPDIKKVAQNATFDVTFLNRRYGIRTNPTHDTMVACAILYPDFRKGLDFINSIYSDIPYYKDDGKYTKDKGTETYWLYNAKDSIVLQEVLPKMLKDLDRSGNMETYETQVALVQPLSYMAEYGIKVNVPALRKISIETGERIAKLEEKLFALVGHKINPRSPQQLMEYFYEEKGLRPFYKGGKKTVDEKALKHLAMGSQTRPSMEEARIILKLRRLTKLKGTYFDMRIDEDDRVRSSINPVGTKFGRFSSSKNIFGTGGNFQNLPPEMKRFLVPDVDHVAYEVDLSQAENRVVAYLGPEPKQIEAFENGDDVHRLTASYIFGKAPEEISDTPGSANIGGGRFSERFFGKRAAHATNYGVGSRTFAKTIEIPEHDARFILTRYERAFPGIKQYQRRIEEQIKRDRTLTNLFGRRCTFRDRWSSELFRAAYSFIPQSTIADKINRHGILFIWNNRHDLFEHVKILNQIHDSIVFEVPISAGWNYHSDVLRAIKTSLEQPLTYLDRNFIIPVEIKMLPHNFKDSHVVDDLSHLEQTFHRAKKTGLD